MWQSYLAPTPAGPGAGCRQPTDLGPVIPKAASERAACSRPGFPPWRKVLLALGLGASALLGESLCLRCQNRISAEALDNGAAALKQSTHESTKTGRFIDNLPMGPFCNMRPRRALLY